MHWMGLISIDLQGGYLPKPGRWPLTLEWKGERILGHGSDFRPAHCISIWLNSFDEALVRGLKNGDFINSNFFPDNGVGKLKKEK